jgi:putative intracellular protease/amidase
MMVSKTKRILMVVSNPAHNLQGWPAGFWGCELTHPYLEFTDAGYEVDIVSPKGGKLELDRASDPRNAEGYETNDIVTMGFLNIPAFVGQIENSRKLSDVDVADYDAVMICGGQASILTFRDDLDLQEAIRTAFESGTVVAALCYGVAALLDIKLSGGEYLLAGKTVTGFSNPEEDAIDARLNVKVNPFRVQDAATQRGARFVAGGIFEPFANRDGALITGQQKFSSRLTAQLVVKTLTL